jgi:type II secretory ATPase GspE/PulE/Tfp pilus assembly ATPase PilB-like protein
VAKLSAVGDVLVRAGLIDSAGLARVRELQEKESVSLGRALATLGLATEEVTAATIANELHLELLNPGPRPVTPEVATLLSADFCHKRCVCPLSVDGNTLRLALTDPLDFTTIQDVEFQTSKRVVAVVGSAAALAIHIDKVYPADLQSAQTVLASPRPEGEIEAVAETEFELGDPAKLAKDTKMPPVVRLVNLILSGAAKEGASDIHLEPKEDLLQVRRASTACFTTS